MEKYNKKDLENLILNEKRSYSYIGKLYNVSGNAIKKAAKKLNILLPKKRKVNKKENFSYKGFKKTSLVNSVNDEIFIKIIKESDKWVDIGKKLGYKSGLSSSVKESVKKRCSSLNIEVKLSVVYDIGTLTKDELFNKRNSYQSSRSGIQKHARKIYYNENKNPNCIICGYSKHVDIAHIKPVSEFNGNVLISEINSLSNLTPLCPNHHWEYDNGLLDLSN